MSETPDRKLVDVSPMFRQPFSFIIAEFLILLSYSDTQYLIAPGKRASDARRSLKQR